MSPLTITNLLQQRVLIIHTKDSAKGNPLAPSAPYTLIQPITLDDVEMEDWSTLFTASTRKRVHTGDQARRPSICIYGDMEALVR